MGRRSERPPRRPGSIPIGIATMLLTLLAAGLLIVSVAAQYQYLLAARKGEKIPAMIEAGALDAMMFTFSMLAFGMSRAGQPARVERSLIMVCALASAAMNLGAADLGSPRSVAAYVVAPVALAVTIDRLVAVVYRWVKSHQQERPAEGAAWGAVGRAVTRVVLYVLRFALSPWPTAKGVRRMVLLAAPVPERTAVSGQDRWVLSAGLVTAPDTGQGTPATRRAVKRTAGHRTLPDGTGQPSGQLTAGQADSGQPVTADSGQRTGDTAAVSGQRSTGQGTADRGQRTGAPASRNANPDAERTRRFVADHPDMSQIDVAAELGISARTVRRHLAGLDVLTGGQDSEADTGQRTAPDSRTADTAVSAERTADTLTVVERSADSGQADTTVTGQADTDDEEATA